MFVRTSRLQCRALTVVLVGDRRQHQHRRALGVEGGQDGIRRHPEGIEEVV